MGIQERRSGKYSPTQRRKNRGSSGLWQTYDGGIIIATLGRVRIASEMLSKGRRGAGQLNHSLSNTQS